MNARKYAFAIVIASTAVGCALETTRNGDADTTVSDPNAPAVVTAPQSDESPACRPILTQGADGKLKFLGYMCEDPQRALPDPARNLPRQPPGKAIVLPPTEHPLELER